MHDHIVLILDIGSFFIFFGRMILDHC